MQRVKVIRRQGQAALVEWHVEEQGPRGLPARYRRAIVPVDSLEQRAATRRGETALHPDPSQGIPYGEDWEGLLGELGVPDATAPVIANELRRVGIWVLADLEADPASARTAFSVGYGLDVQRLRAAARHQRAGG